MPQTYFDVIDGTGANPEKYEGVQLLHGCANKFHFLTDISKISYSKRFLLFLSTGVEQLP